MTPISLRDRNFGGILETSNITSMLPSTCALGIPLTPYLLFTLSEYLQIATALQSVYFRAAELVRGYIE